MNSNDSTKKIDKDSNEVLNNTEKHDLREFKQSLSNQENLDQVENISKIIFDNQYIRETITLLQNKNNGLNTNPTKAFDYGSKKSTNTMQP